MLVRFIKENEIEEFPGVYVCDEEITLENGEKETVRMVFTNSEAENKAKESGEWLEYEGKK